MSHAAAPLLLLAACACGHAPTRADAIGAARAGAAPVHCDWGDGLDQLASAADRARAAGECRVAAPRVWPSIDGRDCRSAFERWRAAAPRDAAERVVYSLQQWIAHAGDCSRLPPSEPLYPECLDRRSRASVSARAGDTEVGLSSNERWRVRRYLGLLAPLVLDGADGAGRANATGAAALAARTARAHMPISLRLREAREPGALVCATGPLMLHSRREAALCARCAAERNQRTYATDLACALGRRLDVLRRRRADATAAEAAELWLWKSGDARGSLRLPGLLKARSLREPRFGVLAPLMVHRHAADLVVAAQLERVRALPFAARAPCAAWRGANTGADALTANGTAGSSRLALVRRWAREAAAGGVRLDVGLVLPSRVSADDPSRAFARGARSLEQLAACRYQLAPEGNDVATSLKWMLYTDSVPVMPAPSAETWALEGSLRPWVHYLPVRSDWADLGDKLAWAEANAEHARVIAAAGRAHVTRVLGQGFDSERRVANAVLDAYQRAIRLVGERAPVAKRKRTCPLSAAERDGARLAADAMAGSMHAAFHRYAAAATVEATAAHAAAERRAELPRAALARGPASAAVRAHLAREYAAAAREAFLGGVEGESLSAADEEPPWRLGLGGAGR